MSLLAMRKQLTMATGPVEMLRVAGRGDPRSRWWRLSDDVGHLVALEPRLIPVLPDAAPAERARADYKARDRVPAGRPSREYQAR
jgi:hypothetical protein